MTEKYVSLKDAGANAAHIYQIMKRDGKTVSAALKLIRELFQLNLIEAKGVMLHASYNGFIITGLLTWEFS